MNWKRAFLNFVYTSSQIQTPSYGASTSLEQFSITDNNPDPYIFNIHDYLFIVCMNSCGSQFLPSTVWIPRIQLRRLWLEGSTEPLFYYPSLSHWSTLKTKAKEGAQNTPDSKTALHACGYPISLTLWWQVYATIASLRCTWLIFWDLLKVCWLP